MMAGRDQGPDAGPLRVLQDILEQPDPPPPEEVCELCGNELGPRHGHVVDVQSRSLMCACRGCAMLFDPEGAGSRFRGLPERYLELEHPVLTQQQWDRLQIPVGMAFFFYNSELESTVALYPSPGGATESELPLEEWDEIVTDNPILEDVIPDVEAFLVREADGRFEGYVVPIDACYRLVGHIRLTWKGFSGGQEAREAIDAFFEEVSSKAQPVDREGSR